MSSEQETSRQPPSAVTEERYRAFVEQSAEGVWCFEVDPPVPIDWPAREQVAAWYERALLTECNNAMARMYGFDNRTDLLGARLGDLLPPDDDASQAYLAAFVASGYRMVDAETREPDRHGAEHYYLNNLTGVVERGHLLRVWGTQRDITRIKELEGQLARAQKLEALGMLAGSIAHDFNNLLTAILGYCQLVLEQTEENDDRQEDLIQIQRAGERAAEMTRQLLAFGRQQPLQPRALPLHEALNDLEPIVRRLLGMKNTLLFRIDPRIGTVRVDRMQLEQVIMNLAVNARDAMPEGGTLTIQADETEVAPADAATGGITPGWYARIVVSDTGIGMDEETRRQVFEPFFTTKQPGKGTGIGLATVFGIVRRSAGQVTLDSTPGAGTTFTILLPLIEAEPEAGTAAARDAAPAPSLTLLLVGEEDRLRSLARRQAERHGHAVLEARTISEAALVASRLPVPVDVLVTDLVLADGAGPELTRRLRREHPDLGVVYLSGYSRGVAIDATDIELRDRYLEKPFSAEELIGAVQGAWQAVRAPA